MMSLKYSGRIFTTKDPQTKEKGDCFMLEKVKEALDKIRPMLKADGGDVELVAVDDGVVKVRLQGA